MGNIKMKFVLKSTLIAITIFVILSLATSRSASKSKTKEIRSIRVVTKKTSDGSGNISNLAALDIKCPTGSAISYFKLERSGGKFNYKHDCLAHLAISTDSKVEYTSWKDREDKGTNFLDRQKVQCTKGKVLSQFRLQTKTGKMRYQFTCTKADLGKCYDKVTPKTNGVKKLGIVNYSWIASVGRGYNVKYFYTINYCDLNKAKEPETPHTVEQQAEDEKDTQANIVDHREREVRRRFK